MPISLLQTNVLKKVDFALPYMNVALGVVSHEDHVITSLDQIGADDQVIVISGTTAETYLEQNEPDIKLQKFDTYAAAKTAFENGTGVAWANDNTEVIAYAKRESGICSRNFISWRSAEYCTGCNKR